MRIHITLERRSRAERNARWGARKARKLRTEVIDALWGSSYPERGSLAYGSGTRVWYGSEWRFTPDPTFETNGEENYVESEVEKAARDLVAALAVRITELEDPCRGR